MIKIKKKYIEIKSKKFLSQLTEFPKRVGVGSPSSGKHQELPPCLDALTPEVFLFVILHSPLKYFIQNCIRRHLEQQQRSSWNSSCNYSLVNVYNDNKAINSK